MNKAIFLDRDGVLNLTVFRNGKPRAPYTMEEFELFPGVVEATKILRQKGFLLIVVTNQPDVARGWVSRESVDAVHAKMNELLDLEEIRICFHTDIDGCTCRKPKPGMLLDASKKWDIDLSKSFMVGDRHSDVKAGADAGCKTILIGAGDNAFDIKPDFEHASLIEACDSILSCID